MNRPTNPISASTSVNAMPRIMVVCSRAASSGWRACPSTVLPTMMPMPIPGPIAERPYPIMLTLPLIAASEETTSPIVCSTCMPFSLLVLFYGGQTDVRRREQREHVRLDGGDEDLQADADDPADERDHREHRGHGVAEQVRRSDERDHEQEVPGEEIREQPDRERERAQE